MEISANNIPVHGPVFQRDIASALRFFVERKGIRAVWLYGSSSRIRPLDWRSDLDFAVAGLEPGEEYEVWSQLDEILEHQVDLIRLEDANPLLKEEILNGILLYEN